MSHPTKKLKIENEEQMATQNKYPPLVSAAIKGDLEEIKSLIEKGANINNVEEQHPSKCYSDPDNNIFTPLNRACFYGHVTVVRYLLQMGADPNYSRNSRRRNLPIMYAIENETSIASELLILLFKYGANLDPATLLINQNNHGVIKDAFFTSTSEIAKLLMIAREKSVESPFHKNNFPLDLFKIIYKYVNDACLNEIWSENSEFVWKYVTGVCVSDNQQADSLIFGARVDGM